MLSIVIPAHNEAARIDKTLQDYLEYFNGHYHADFEIIVVPNGCVDNTMEIVTNYNSNCGRIKVHDLKKADKGHAVMEGCKIAKGEIVCFTDADGATSPREMHRLTKELRGNDAIIGSRWLRESNIVKSQGIFRKTASRGFNILVRLLFALPFKDTQCGAKVFKKVALDDIMGELKFPGYIFDVELIYRLCQKGYKIKETAITWENKPLSSVNLLTEIPGMLVSLLWLRLSKRSAKQR